MSYEVKSLSNHRVFLILLTVSCCLGEVSFVCVVPGYGIRCGSVHKYTTVLMEYSGAAHAELKKPRKGFGVI